MKPVDFEVDAIGSVGLKNAPPRLYYGPSSSDDADSKSRAHPTAQSA